MKKVEHSEEVKGGRYVKEHDIVLYSVRYRDVQSLLGCIGIEVPQVDAMDCVAHCRRMLALCSASKWVRSN